MPNGDLQPTLESHELKGLVTQPVVKGGDGGGGKLAAVHSIFPRHRDSISLACGGPPEVGPGGGDGSEGAGCRSRCGGGGRVP
jgi:hypothetical protein